MRLSSRERLMAFALLMVGALFTLDRLAWQPYFDRRNELLKLQDEKQTAEHQATRVLRQAERLKPVMASLNQTLKDDTSETEGQLLHLMQEWEKSAGLKDGSFVRIKTVDEHGFVHLTFHISGTGGMRGVASLLYSIETAAIPLRVDEVHVTPKEESGNELQVMLNVSALCRAKSGAPVRKTPVRTVATIASGGQP